MACPAWLPARIRGLMGWRIRELLPVSAFTMSEPQEPHGPLIEVGRYARLAAARERALVVAARTLPHWIERDGDAWVLRVEPGAEEEVQRERAAFENEERARPPTRPVFPEGKIPTLSLYVAAAVLAGFFAMQNRLGPAWSERGVAQSAEILRGEWWRTVTALTLHADASHVGANLATGLLFAAFLLPRFGTGATWLAVVLSGALGNALNAWGYRGAGHGSIGASTACFGALGMLMGAELFARWREPETRSRWQLVLPLGAGLGLLAFLGVGEEGGRVDYMAHCWGFVVGTAAGLLLEWLRVKERASPAVQRTAAAAALGLLGAAWVLALR